MGKILIIVAILLLIAGGFFYYQSTKKPAETAKEETKEESATPTEEPTPADVAKDAFTIELLNGSGIAGEAGRAQELLEGEEFKIDSTGNAENYDFEETVIQAGSEVDEAWINQLRNALAKKYSVKSGVTKLDPADSESDVVVIVGSFDKDGESMVVEEPTEAATPQPTGESVTTTTTPSPTQTLTPTPTP